MRVVFLFLGVFLMTDGVLSTSTNDESCPHPHEDGDSESNRTRCDSLFKYLDDFNGVITTKMRLQWPCPLLEFWHSYLPFVNLVKGLLHQGTLLIVIVGVVFNGLALAVLTMPGMRAVSTNNYLAILAIYDTCTLTFNFLTGVLRGQNSDSINKNFQDSEGLCKFHSVCVDIFTLLSVWIIVCVTFERFLAVQFPLKVTSWCTVGKARKTILGVSLILVAFSMHKIFITGFEGDSVFGYKACHTTRLQLKEVIYIFVALSTWIPVLTVIGLNVGIVRKLNQRFKKQTTLGLAGDPERKEQQDRLTKMLLTLSSAYLILVLPLGILQSSELYWNNVRVVPPSDQEPQMSQYIEFMRVKITLKWIRAFCFFFYQLNFMCNFFLYCVSGARFRAALVRLLCSDQIKDTTGTVNTKQNNPESRLTMTSDMQSKAGGEVALSKIKSPDQTENEEDGPKENHM